MDFVADYGRKANVHAPLGVVLRKFCLSPISSRYVVVHKKYLLAYQPYAASVFFARALSRLELELNQSFPKLQREIETRDRRDRRRTAW